MQTGEFNNKIKKYIREWETKCYNQGLPDEAHEDIERNKLAPSYRRICLSILKNDCQLQSLGYNRPRSLAYDELKKIELKNKGIIIQLNLF